MSAESEYDIDYDVLDIALADFAGQGRQRIVKAGIPLGGLTIVELPAAAIGKVRLAFGRGPLFQLRAEGIPIVRDPPRMSGLDILVDAGVVGNLELLVGFDLEFGDAK